MWAKVGKFAPLLAVIGYIIPYTSKGFDRILIDLQSITVDKLQAKWQNLAIVVGAGVALYLLKGLKMPVAFKALATLALYGVIGYNLALTIDPPAPTSRAINPQVKFVQPSTYNPYARH